MISLSTTSDQILLQKTEADDVHVSVTYIDFSNGAGVPATLNTLVDTNDPTVIVPSPSASVRRVVKTVHIHNASPDTTTNIVTSFNDGTLVSSLMEVSLLFGESLVYTDHGGWKKYDSEGRDYGSLGFTGSRGFAGSAGFVGSSGAGFTGSRGFTGSAGAGFTGSKGDVGFTGSKGDTGDTGATGFTGSKGDIGFTGSKGDTGFTGSKGDIGFTGSAGTRVITEVPANETGEGITIIKTAGEAISQFDPVYLGVDEKVYKADASGAETYPAFGIANEDIAEDATGHVLILGTARDDTWNWAVGVALYLNTGGGLTQTPPSATDDVIQIVGFCHPNPDTIFVRPSVDYVVHA